MTKITKIIDVRFQTVETPLGIQKNWIVFVNNKINDSFDLKKQAEEHAKLLGHIFNKNYQKRKIEHSIEVRIHGVNNEYQTAWSYPEKSRKTKG